MKKSLIYLAMALILLTTLSFAAVVNQENTGFDHSIFDRLLKQNVHNGFVDYTSLSRKVGQLDKYLKLIGAQNPELLSRNEQLAFYINAYNAYNAFTIKLILNHLGKISSIRDIHKPWDQKIWIINGLPHSLNEIENKILRAKFSEPRIHFAIVCASIGCPDLQPFAYTGKELEAQLTNAAKAFLSSPKHLQISGNTVRLSQIFNWFCGDFKKVDGSVINFVIRNADKQTSAKLLALGRKAKVKFLSYNWNLNGK